MRLEPTRKVPHPDNEKVEAVAVRIVGDSQEILVLDEKGAARWVPFEKLSFHDQT